MKTLSSRGLAYLYRYPSGKKEVLKRLDEAQNTFFRGRGSSSTLVELNVRAFERIYPMPKFSDPNRFRLHPQYEEDLNRLRTWYWSSVENLLKAAIRKLIDARQELLYSGNVNEQEIIQLLDWLRELKEPFKDSTVASNTAEKWRALRNQNILEGINRTSFFEKRLRGIEDFVDEGGKKHRAFYYLSKKLSYEDLLIFHINYISVSTEDKTKLLVRLIDSSLKNFTDTINHLQELKSNKTSNYRYFEPLLKLVVINMFPDPYRQKNLRELCQNISQERISWTLADWTDSFLKVFSIVSLFAGAIIPFSPLIVGVIISAIGFGGEITKTLIRLDEQRRVGVIDELEEIQILDQELVKKEDENPWQSLAIGLLTDLLISKVFKGVGKALPKKSQRKINDFIAEWRDNAATNVKKKIVAKKTERGVVDTSRSNTRDLDKVNKQEDRILTKAPKEIQETYLENRPYARKKINNMPIRPSNISTFYGRSVGQLKRKLIKAIQNNPNHPLSVLFENGKLIRPSSRHHDVLGNDPRIIEMFHAESKHALDINQKEIVIIGGAFKNQRMGATIERHGWQQTPVALDIGGFAVDEDLVVDLIASGYWKKEILNNAFRIELPVLK